MKKGQIYNYTGRILLLLLILLFTLPLMAQKEGGKKKRTRHRISYINKADTVKYLQSYIYESAKGIKTEIEGENISFYVVTDSGEVLFIKSISDENGKAIGVLPREMDFPNDSGTYTFVAKFEGNDIYKSASADIAIRDIKVDVEFEEEDSIKTIIVQLRNPDSGEKIKDVNVNFYVERMFSSLKIGEEETNRKGIATLAFPDDLPGDVDGNVTVLVKIEDDELHGNFETSEKLAWGVPIYSNGKTLRRALWSPYAPMWMVVTFIILMGLSWGHFMAIALMLFRIKRDDESHTGEILWDD